MPSIQSAADVKANADLLRRLATTIGLTGQTLVEVCQRIIIDAWAETVPIDGVARLDPSPDTVENA